MPTAPRAPFDVRLSADARDDLTSWLALELDNALAVRTASDNDVAYWHTLYEQGRTRNATNSPWPDAADLTSTIPCEKVDTLEAAIVDTIFSEQIWTVEGWGDSAKRAPFVEEFHQWQAELEGFQSVFERAVHLSLIEPRGVLEVYEEAVRRPVRKQITAALQLAPDGSALIGADLRPVFQTTPEGRYVEVSSAPTVDPATGQPIPPPPSAEVVVDDYELVARGPRSRVIAYRDFLQLPGHAREKSEVWGYAKRFWRRIDELRERAGQGVYDAEAVTEIGTDDERAEDTTLAGEAKAVATKDGPLAEKELWEVVFLKDLDRTGLRWYVATLHKDRRTLLRLQYDDIGRPRFFPLVPFPRPNSTEGYSLVGHKLITVTEEDTAWRNMLADRAAIQIQAPLKRLQGALWDPDDEPIGPKAVITVRDMREVEALQMPDYTSPAIERLRDIERKAEKLVGITDIAAGVNPVADRTLGETRMVAFQGQMRMRKAIRNIQESLEDIAQVRHLMWKRALAAMPDGLDAPSSILKGLETRGVDVTEFEASPRFTAQMLEGAFRFKPKGSVESADKAQQRADFNESLTALSTVASVNPMVGAILQGPAAAKAILEQWVRLYNVADKAAFVGAEANAAIQQFLMQQQAQQQMALQQQGMAPPPDEDMGAPDLGTEAPG